MPKPFASPKVFKDELVSLLLLSTGVAALTGDSIFSFVAVADEFSAGLTALPAEGLYSLIDAVKKPL